MASSNRTALEINAEFALVHQRKIQAPIITVHGRRNVKLDLEKRGSVAAESSCAAG